MQSRVDNHVIISRVILNDTCDGKYKIYVTVYRWVLSISKWQLEKYSCAKMESLIVMGVYVYRHMHFLQMSTSLSRFCSISVSYNSAISLT